MKMAFLWNVLTRDSKVDERFSEAMEFDQLIRGFFCWKLKWFCGNLWWWRWEELNSVLCKIVDFRGIVSRWWIRHWCEDLRYHWRNFGKGCWNGNFVNSLVYVRTNRFVSWINRRTWDYYVKFHIGVRNESLNETVPIIFGKCRIA